MTKNFELSEDIYNFLEKISMEKENVKELVEYVHYKALLDSFTFFIENNNGNNMDFLLPDYVEVISKVQVIISKIKDKYDRESKEQLSS